MSPDAATPLPPIKYTGALEDIYERVLRLDVVDVEIIARASAGDAAPVARSPAEDEPR